MLFDLTQLKGFLVEDIRLDLVSKLSYQILHEVFLILHDFWVLVNLGQTLNAPEVPLGDSTCNLVLRFGL